MQQHGPRVEPRGTKRDAMRCAATHSRRRLDGLDVVVADVAARRAATDMVANRNEASRRLGRAGGHAVHCSARTQAEGLVARREGSGRGVAERHTNC